jgi:hypothetical protein
MNGSLSLFVTLTQAAGDIKETAPAVIIICAIAMAAGTVRIAGRPNDPVEQEVICR